MSGPRPALTTPESLAGEGCAELRAGTPRLTTEEARSLAAGVAGEWQIDEGEIRREFTCKTFNAAFGLATRIALLAEAQGHHPELEVGWGRLVVRLSTPWGSETPIRTRTTPVSGSGSSGPPGGVRDGVLP